MPPAETHQRLVPIQGEKWLLGGLLVVLTLIAYAPALRGDFIWDDKTYMVNNPRIHSPDGLWMFWTSTNQTDYWPLTYSSFWLEWRLWGKSTLGYHLTNVFLHAACGLLVWAILARLKIPGAFLAGMLFVLHPVNVESVAWIFQRKNTLSLLFFLLAFLWYVKFFAGDGKRWYAAALAAFALSLLAKTASVMLPPVLAVFIWWQQGRIGRRDVLQLAPFFAVAILLGSVAVWFQSQQSIATDVVREDNLLSRALLAGRAVWFYLYKALLPLNLSFVYPRWEVDTGSILAYLPLVLLVAFATCVGIWACFREAGRVWFFALCFFVLNLVPILGFVNVYFMRYSFVADHWQYTSMIAVASVVASGLTVGLSRISIRGAYFTVGGVLVLTLSLLTWHRAGFYQNEEALWSDTVKRNPNSSMAHNSLGKVLADKPSGTAADIARAKRLMVRAVELDVRNPEAHYNLGNLLAEGGNRKDAIRHYIRAIELRPRYYKARNNLAFYYLDQGQYQKAAVQLMAALRETPNFEPSLNQLGLLYVQIGKPKRARTIFEKVLATNPKSVTARSALGELLLRQGDIEQAILHLSRAVDQQPEDAALHHLLGAALVQSGNYTQGETHLRLAAEGLSGSAEVHNNLGVALERQKKYVEAAAIYRQALLLDGSYEMARENLERVQEKLSSGIPPLP